MTRAASPLAAPRGTPSREWRGVAVAVGLLAVEASVLWLVHGRWLGADTAFAWSGVPLLAILAGWWWHADRHRAAYRDAPLRWPLVACQAAAFAALMLALARVSDAPLRAVLQDGPSRLALALPAAAWLLASLAAVVPTLAIAGEWLAVTAAAAAFGAAVVGNAYLTQRFWDSSGDTTVRLVEMLLAPFADGPVIRPQRFVVGTPTFTVEIEHKCSGFQGIGLVATLLAGYLWWFRRCHRFPQALLLLPIGIVLIWLANLVRITALILVGIYVSPAIAVDGFHSTAGWIAFVTVGLGTIWVASRIPFFTKPEALPATAAGLGGPGDTADAIPETFSVAACILPFLALTGIAMLTRLFSAGFDLLYPARVVGVALVLYALRKSYPLGDWRPSAVPVAIGAVSFAVWMTLAPGPGSEELTARLDPTQLGQPWTALWLLFRAAGSIVIVPIAEELFFRGFVVRRCIDADIERVPVGRLTAFSLVASSLAFGLLHGQAWLAGTVVGMLFAGALAWRRRLGDAVVAHATTNALVSGYVVATGSWTQWG